MLEKTLGDEIRTEWNPLLQSEGLKMEWSWLLSVRFSYVLFLGTFVTCCIKSSYKSRIIKAL